MNEKHWLFSLPNLEGICERSRCLPPVTLSAVDNHIAVLKMRMMNDATTITMIDNAFGLATQVKHLQ